MGTEERTLGQTLNTWVQTIGIVCAGAWALLYTFGYKDIFVPKSAPVNISLNLSLKKVGPKASSTDSLTAVEMKIAATNPSSRPVYLLRSAWVAIGCTIRPRLDGSGAQQNDQLNSNSYDAVADFFLFELRANLFQEGLPLPIRVSSLKKLSIEPSSFMSRQTSLMS